MSERMAKPYLFIGALAASVVLSGVIGFMIADRAAILRDGREVSLKVEPIDPRDLLRGRYVRLGFEARRVSVKDPAALMADADSDDERPQVFVAFEEGPDGQYLPQDALAERPAGGVFIAATALEPLTRRSLEDAVIEVDYGLERFYTNEQRAPLLEQRMRDGEITIVVVAVDDAGRPQIKALKQGNDVIVTEPLY